MNLNLLKFILKDSFLNRCGAQIWIRLSCSLLFADIEFNLIFHLSFNTTLIGCAHCREVQRWFMKILSQCHPSILMLRGYNFCYLDRPHHNLWANDSMWVFHGRESMWTTNHVLPSIQAAIWPRELCIIQTFANVMWEMWQTCQWLNKFFTSCDSPNEVFIQQSAFNRMICELWCLYHWTIHLNLG